VHYARTWTSICDALSALGRNCGPNNNCALGQPHFLQLGILGAHVRWGACQTSRRARHQIRRLQARRMCRVLAFQTPHRAALATRATVASCEVAQVRTPVASPGAQAPTPVARIDITISQHRARISISTTPGNRWLSRFVAAWCAARTSRSGVAIGLRVLIATAACMCFRADRYVWQSRMLMIIPYVHPVSD
jgi:hypothetical protein